MENKDYINPADGLLYCGKCHTPKQCRVTAFGRETTPYCTCECEQKRLAEEKARCEELKKQQFAAFKQRQRNNRIQNKEIDLLLELDNGTTGHITVKILSREEKH